MRGMATGVPSPAPADAVRPVPPRFGWLKRIALALAAWIGVLVAARLLWGWEADRRMRAKIAEYRAAGEPVLIEDFQRPPIPDDENAAVLYKQAFREIAGVAPIVVTADDGTQVNVTLVDLIRYPEWLERYPTEIARLFDGHGEALRLARAARARPRCDWGLPFTPPLMSAFPGPSTASQRALTRVVCGAVLVQHMRGQDAEAVELLRDGLAFSDRMNDPAQFLIGYLVALACDALVSDKVAPVSVDLRLASEDENGHPDPGMPTRAQVRQLMVELHDESGIQRCWGTAFMGERAFLFDTVQVICEGRTALLSPTAIAPPAWGESLVRPVLAPLWQLVGRRMLEHISNVHSAGHANAWPQGHARVDWEWAQTTTDWLQFPVPGGPSTLLGSYDRCLELHFRGLAQRRMAATALAIRLYEVDHGRRPATLDELVPAYLPAVPVDPFTEDASPLRYLPDGAPARLYSIGENGVDDGSPVQPTTGGGWRPSRDDVTVILDALWRPAATQPTSAQAPNDEGDVEQTGRQQQSEQQ